MKMKKGILSELTGIKPIDLEDLSKHVRELSSYQDAFKAKVFKYGNESVRTERHEVRVNGHPLCVNPTEEEANKMAEEINDWAKGFLDKKEKEFKVYLKGILGD